MLAARFGTDERWFDVTQIIRPKISDGRLDGQPADLARPGERGSTRRW